MLLTNFLWKLEGFCSSVSAGVCSLKDLRVGNLQILNMGSKRIIPSRHRSLSTYEVMFTALFAILMVLCAGLIAVSWLTIKGSEKGKSHRVGSWGCCQMNVHSFISRILPAYCIHCCAFMTRYLYCIQMLPCSSPHGIFLSWYIIWNSELKHKTKFLK